MTDDMSTAKSPRQRHREACAALDAAVARNDPDAMREALREIKAAETDDQAYADPLAAAVAARCGVRADDEPPPEQKDQRGTRDLAVADSPTSSSRDLDQTIQVIRRNPLRAVLP